MNLLDEYSQNKINYSEGSKLSYTLMFQDYLEIKGHIMLDKDDIQKSVEIAKNMGFNLKTIQFLQNELII